MKKTVKVVSLLLALCQLLGGAVLVFASDETPPEPVVVDRSIDTERYYEIQNELNSISSQVREIEREYDSDYPSEYYQLKSKFNDLLAELDELGSIDEETLEALPAPATVSTYTLPGNLADLEKSYKEWFNFSGYEESVSYLGTTYRAYVVTIRDRSDNGGLLANMDASATLVSEKDSSALKAFDKIMATSFQYIAQGIATTLDLGSIKTWILKKTFEVFCDLVSSGDIVLNGVNGFYYTTYVTSESQLQYIYVYNETTKKWVFCLSSGTVYVDQKDTLDYSKFIGGSGKQYGQFEEVKKSSFTIIPYEINKLGSKAVSLYVNAGNRQPYTTYSYQVGKLDVMRCLGGNGSFQKQFTFGIVSCVNPGDLWTLGYLD